MNLRSVFIANNIVLDNWGFDIATFDSTSNLHLLDQNKIVIENNLVGSYLIKETPIGFWQSQVYAIKNQTVGVKPVFVSTNMRDFSLPKRSAATNKSIRAYDKIYYYKNLGANAIGLEKMKTKVLFKK
jgi:hypothetical protein